MIIKATRISTASGAGGVGGHVYSHKGNEEVLELQGCREDLDDMVEDAERHGAKFSIRHVIISPEQATTREEALDLVREYAREFGGDADRAVVVEHLKPREDGEGFERHWHAMIPEVQNGRVLESSWMRARHEKLSRVAEIELGHGLVAGRWNKAVENALRADGRNDLADRVIPLTEGFRSTSSYTSDQHQTAKRAGLSMPHTKATAKAAAAATWSAADGGQAFVAALAEQNLRLKPGEKAGVILIEGQNASGEWLELGAVDRMIKGDRKDVANRLSGIDFESVFDQTRRLPVTAESLNGADTVSAPQPMAAPASPGHAPVRAAGGGKAAATVGGDSDPILNAPDPKVPGSVEKWLMAVGEQEQRKAKRAVEALSKLTEGGEGGPDKKQIEEIRDAIDQLIERWREAAQRNKSAKRFGATADRYLEIVREIEVEEGLGNRGPQNVEVHDSRGPGRDAPGTGRAGNEPRDVRGDHVGTANGFVVATPEPTGTSQGRDVEDRRADRGGREGVGQPEADRIQVGRHRVEGSRIEIALAAPERASALDRIRFKAATLAGPMNLPTESDRLRGEFQQAKAGAVDTEKERWRAALDRQRVAAAMARAFLAGGAGRMAPEARERLREVISEGKESIVARLRETRPEKPTWERFLQERGAAGDVAAKGIYRRAVEQRETKERLAAGFTASAARVERVLSTAPFPDPAQRDPKEVAWSLREQIRTKLTSEETKAAETRQAAQHAKSTMGILGRLGFPTADRREAAELAEAAEVAQRKAVLSGESYDSDVRDSDTRAPDVARARQRQRAAWEQQPEVKKAVEEQFGNELVKAAIRGGDKSIEKLAGQDLAKAREEMLRRKAEAEAELARQREREAAQRMRNQPGNPNPAPGPRRR